MKKKVIFFASLALLLLVIVVKLLGPSKKTLYVFMWSSYIKPDIIEKFEKEFDCHVVVDTYDSNETMYTKLKLGASGYDVVFPSNYFLDLMTQQNMLIPLQKELLPNISHLDEKFLSSLHLQPNPYGIPYFMSFSGIGYRSDRVHNIPHSWAVFDDASLKGRMTLLNDMRETMGIALRFLGYSANSRSKDEITKAKKILLRWKKNLAKLESEQYKNGLVSAEYLVVHGYGGDVAQLQANTPEIAFIYAKEGSLVSLDYASIMKDCKEIALAHAFINFLHRPEIAGENMNFTKYRCPNIAAKAFLDKELVHSPLIFPDETDTKLECIFPVGNAQSLYTKAWDAIKSGER